MVINFTETTIPEAPDKVSEHSYTKKRTPERNKEISRQFENKEIGEDEKFKLKEKVQESVDRANGEIEKILEAKITEIEE